MTEEARRRVLVIDRSRRLTLAWRTLLENARGYVVQEVNDARRAVAAAVRFRPDLVMLAIAIPHKDGGDVAAEMRAHPALREAPIVFMASGLSVEQAERYTRGSGNHVVVDRSSRMMDVLQVVDECLGVESDPEAEVVAETPVERLGHGGRRHNSSMKPGPGTNAMMN